MNKIKIRVLGYVDSKTINNIVDYYHEHYLKSWTTKDHSYHKSVRAIGILEGILECYGIIKPGAQLELKDKTVTWQPMFSRKTKSKVRKETFNEAIVRMARDLAQELSTLD